MRERAEKRGVWAEAAMGAASGLAASWVMSRFMERLQEATPEPVKEEIEKSQPGEPPTVRTAQAVAAPVLGRPLRGREKEAAEPIVHYAFGAAVGIVYALSGMIAPVARSGLGLPYGTAVWALADQVALPGLGLMSPPEEQPLAQHAGALASHLVYGAALWAGLSLLEALL